MPIMMTAAIVLGVLVAGIFGFALRGTGDADAATRWEGIAATGLFAVVLGGPVWIAQGVCTLLATLGDATPWLWAWFVGAPVLGMAVGQSLPSKG
jgi:hypothetical protein